MSGAMNSLGRWYACFLHFVRKIDWLGPLALRIYLAPIFIMAGLNKMGSIEDVAAWFGNPDWGLGLPAPMLMAWLAALVEFFGGIAILVGFGTRLVAIPLMFVMAIAALTAHWENGWSALPDKTLTAPWEWREDLIDDAVLRKERVVALLKEHGNYEWLVEAGNITILKNGIEFAATYFIMLLALLCSGAGRFFSIDYWLCRRYCGRDPS
ncbi:HvfX family Cu-binding RiPP maturation protein [Microbulbifer spongiae]|uniref:DoxX family protein n=1 Tax=Microbulbifer spongiae TaxID=2944933 RepID=A0ABY9ECI1_9GAMM|nr:DoxX family protein [Microbulbifer sp. MI-G]WKD50738.1 DoxX family protein [Microbulbifer sp. MI-G]